jgi:flagellar biosynthesis protein FlhG
VLVSQQQRSVIRLIVNQVSQLGEGRSVRAQLQRVVDRFVKPESGHAVTLDLLGAVPADATVREAVQKRQLLLEVYPGSRAALAVNEVAGRLAP